MTPKKLLDQTDLSLVIGYCNSSGLFIREPYVESGLHYRLLCDERIFIRLTDHYFNPGMFIMRWVMTNGQMKNGAVSFEEVLVAIPREVAIELLYHLDLFAGT